MYLKWIKIETYITIWNKSQLFDFFCYASSIYIYIERERERVAELSDEMVGSVFAKKCKGSAQRGVTDEAFDNSEL